MKYWRIAPRVDGAELLQVVPPVVYCVDLVVWITADVAQEAVRDLKDSENQGQSRTINAKINANMSGNTVKTQWKRSENRYDSVKLLAAADNLVLERRKFKLKLAKSVPNVRLYDKTDVLF